MLRLPLRTIDDAPESTQGRPWWSPRRAPATWHLIGSNEYFDRGLEAGDVLFGSKAPF